MMKIYTTVMSWIYGVTGSVWLWCNQLDRQQWLVLMACATVLGFFCMRGYGSRNDY